MLRTATSCTIPLCQGPQLEARARSCTWASPEPKLDFSSMVEFYKKTDDTVDTDDTDAIDDTESY